MKAANSPTAPASSAQKSTWPRPTSTCATPSCTASSTPRTTALATSGASTPCTTTPTASPTPSSTSPTPCARSSSLTTSLSIAGSSSSSASSPRTRFEFDRLNLTYTMLSKRKLLQLVQEKHVNGWDDPRMPTLSGIRRRGFAPEAIRTFCRPVGAPAPTAPQTSKCSSTSSATTSTKSSRRAMAVLIPLKLVITNFDGSRRILSKSPTTPKTHPPARARYPSRATSTSSRTTSAKSLRPSTTASHRAKKSACATPTSSPRTRSSKTQPATSSKSTAPMIRPAAAATPPTAAKSSPPSTGSPPPTPSRPKSASTTSSSPSPIPTTFPEGGTFLDNLNPNSLEILTNAKLEPSLATAKPGDQFQFERLGYFCFDKDSHPNHRLQPHPPPQRLLVQNRKKSQRIKFRVCIRCKPCLSHPPFARSASQLAICA